MTDTLTVTAEDARKRLDIFVAEHTSRLTRSQAKKRIEAGNVLVNGKAASVHRFLNEGDTVEIQALDAANFSSNASEGPDVGSKPERRNAFARNERNGATHSPALNILFETPSYLVAIKPEGVLMHPTSKDETDTFIDAIIAHAPEVARVGEDPAEPGIVSRLDRDVSGLVVIAKTQDAYDDLKRQFKTRHVEKTYLALVYGIIPQDFGDLKFRIARSTSKARMAALPKESAGGRAAWTHYDVVERLNGATLLRLNILTGRSHQIRAHLFAFNHPVIGDALYHPRSTKRRVTAPRILLESVALAFDDPDTGERKQFEIKPDPAFKTVSQQLR